MAYAGWLLAVQAGALTDADVEPPVPPGLATLAAPVVALAEFLRVDGDLLAAAGDGAPEESLSPAALRTWVSALPETENGRWLVRAAERPIAEELRAAYRAQTGAPPTSGAPSARCARGGGCLGLGSGSTGWWLTARTTRKCA